MKRVLTLSFIILTAFNLYSQCDVVLITNNKTDVTCFGASDGTVQVSATTSNLPVSFTSNGITNSTGLFTNYSAGIHEVVATDNIGCQDIINIIIGEPSEPLNISFAISTITCFGNTDGSVIATVQGGTPSINGYTYNWSTGQSNSSITALLAGSYTVTVIDSLGCTTTKTATVGEPSPILNILSSTSTTCPNGEDGQATIVTSGGTPNTDGSYQYVWNNTPSSTTNIATNLTGGQTYLVTIIDANGCLGYDSVTVAQPQEIENTIQTQDISCNGFTDGSVDLTTTGGTPPFQYQWDSRVVNSNNNQASDLAVGNYVVTITDFNGCETTTMTSIEEPSRLDVLVFTEDIICKGESTGSVSALVAGGTPWYSFTWDTNLSTQDTSIVSNVSAGTYSLTVTDGNGCKNIKSVLIEEPVQGIATTYAIEHVSCFGERDGQINVNTFGGQGPYEYSLGGNRFSSSDILVGLNAGEYTLNVRDNLGCLFTDNISIVEPAEITLELGEDILLIDDEKAPLVPVIANAVPPISYAWSSEDTTLNCLTCPVPIIENINQTYRYFLTVTDLNGCKVTDDVFVRVDKEAVVFVATGFTPNNDNVNDYLYVQANEGVERVVAFQVFDRLGQVVFESSDTPVNDETFGWNGYFKNSFVNNGVFGWTLIVEFEDGERGSYQGNTTIIR